MNAADEPPRLVVPVGSRDHIQGVPGATVTLVEYGDYECPYCGEAYPIVKEIQKRMRSELRFVFRNFPLANSHPHATLAAIAAEAAGTLGSFWEMHDTLYEHQDALTEADLVRYAEQLGIEKVKFEKEMHRSVIAERVQEDFSSGVRSGVNGTPTFYINDVRHDGSYDVEELMGALEAARRTGPKRASQGTESRRARRRSTQ
ncbi:MAG: DsbA family protein [Thermoplasmata archaeon]